MFYTRIKKMMFVVMCVFIVMINGVVVKADELNKEVVGAEVTVEPEKKFTSYNTPEEDVIIYDENYDEENEIEVNSKEEALSSALDKDVTNKVQESVIIDEEIAMDVVPQTGDNSNIVVWGVILGVAFIAMIVVGILLFKKK